MRLSRNYWRVSSKSWWLFVIYPDVSWTYGCCSKLPGFSKTDWFFRWWFERFFFKSVPGQWYPCMVYLPTSNCFLRQLDPIYGVGKSSTLTNRFSTTVGNSTVEKSTSFWMAIYDMKIWGVSSRLSISWAAGEKQTKKRTGWMQKNHPEMLVGNSWTSLGLN